MDEQQIREMNWALGRIKDYAEQHGLTPDHVCDVFTAGILAYLAIEQVASDADAQQTQ